MRYWVLGRGLFGWNLARELQRRALPHRVLGHDEVDLSDLRLDALALEPGDVLVNAAGMTNVDACEDAPEAAMRANAEAPARLAAFARSRGARFAHVSSDAVLDVTNAYARSKAEGERRVAAADPGALQLRVSTTFGPHPTKPDFVTWVLGMLRKGAPFRVVEDFVSTPTYAPDAARALVALVEAGRGGVHAWANAPPIGRWAFARAVQDAWGLDGDIRPMRMDDFKAFRAPRPRRTVLEPTATDLLRPMPFAACLADYRADPHAERPGKFMSP